MDRPPPVLAYHLIWTAYGWWLPNDPRGSMSRTIRNDIIVELGELHYGRKKVQPNSRELKGFFHRAREVMKFALLEFSEAEIVALGGAVRDCVSKNRYTCYACAIMPDHVHVLIRRHRDRAEEMVGHLQDATRLLIQRDHAGRWCGSSQEAHPVWGGPGWKVFLDHPDDIRRTIRYIESNPVKIRRPVQRWEFVAPYDGWPFAGRTPPPIG
ncbi:MAG: hypothetical protein BWX88_04002 [Planctomycetes bacterium ADurb.Bin126]|nr:MAG: hypothetical protein BWX88_04002 [Planctomycetes bacterium ADurb.Bin126]